MDFDPDRNAFEVPYVVFDFETTGLSAEDDDIIEIGAVRIEKGRQTDVFQSLVNPLRPIPAQASAVNGLFDKDVAEAPTLDEVLPDFLNFIRGGVLVAHNAKFDTRFLGAALRRFKITDLPNYVMDTLTLSHRVNPQASEHTLKAICERLNLVNKRAHRAHEDAEVTGKVLLEFLHQLNTEGHRTFRQVATLHGVPLGRVNGAKSGISADAFIEQMSNTLF